MKVRGVQFSPKLGNVADNLRFHEEQVQRAVRDGMELIVFPELSLSGYQLKDIILDVILQERSPEVEMLRLLSRDIAIVVGLPLEREAGLVYNSALCFADGKLLHRHDKTQLPNFGMFEERMIFTAGCHFRTFPLGEFTAGILICRELLFPVTAYLHYLQGCDFLIGISNSPHRGMGERGFASHQLWETMGYVFSQFFHQNYLFVNRSGFEDGLGFGGGSFFARAGEGIVGQARYLENDTIDCDVVLQDVRRARLAGNYRRDEQPEIILNELQRIIHARNQL
jgi:predicted amidohydrolase